MLRTVKVEAEAEATFKEVYMSKEDKKTDKGVQFDSIENLTDGAVAKGPQTAARRAPAKAHELVDILYDSVVKDASDKAVRAVGRARRRQRKNLADKAELVEAVEQLNESEPGFQKMLKEATAEQEEKELEVMEARLVALLK